ncbi:hypothetical protein LVD15_26765 [Fulvivirga maritima]|uniref:hypothetical protein n=1 Tax=Fulvivirga maritima TaxID=2904247 RepID=UPI001F1F811D|nr:hypothetical protein [Fulvivirga maritima]UII26852.1 hypothetical protein LVD15_26765 [Fulvivirga maritima]
MKESGNSTLGGTFDKKPGIYTVSIEGGKGKRITESGEYPQFSVKGDRIFYQTGGYFFGNLTKRLKKCQP